MKGDMNNGLCVLRGAAVIRDVSVSKLELNKTLL